MNNLSVIIPSRTWRNLVQCVGSIREARYTERIIVIDDGLEYPDQVELDRFRFIPRTVHFVDGAKPFIFARNINIGIRETGTDDVVLCNDDALLQIPGGFSAMQRAAYEHPEYGILSAACNNVGNPNQHRHLPPEEGIRDEPRTLCFVCVFVPRRTIDALGGTLMDETFGGIDEHGEEIYGFCDDDVCLRLRQAGLKLGVFDGCFVDHASLPSSFRADGPRSLEPGQRHFIRKHGVDNYEQPKETSQWRHLFE